MSQGVVKGSTSHLQYLGLNPRSLGNVGDSYTAAWLSGLQGGYKFMLPNGIFFSASLGLDIDNTTVTKSFQDRPVVVPGVALQRDVRAPAQTLSQDMTFTAGTSFNGRVTMVSKTRDTGEDYRAIFQNRPGPLLEVQYPLLGINTTFENPNGGALGLSTFSDYISVGNRVAIVVGNTPKAFLMPIQDNGFYDGDFGVFNNNIGGSVKLIKSVPASEFAEVLNVVAWNANNPLPPAPQMVNLGVLTQNAPNNLDRLTYMPFGTVTTPDTGIEIVTGSVGMAAGSQISATTLPAGSLLPAGLKIDPVTYKTKLKRDYSLNLLMQIGKQFPSGFAPYITTGITQTRFSAKIMSYDPNSALLQTVSKKKMDRQAVAIGIGSYYALTPKDSLNVQYLHQLYRQGSPFKDTATPVSLEIPKEFQSFTIGYSRKL